MGVTALLTSVSKDQFCVSSARSRCTKIVAFLFSSNLKPMSLHCTKLWEQEEYEICYQLSTTN